MNCIYSCYFILKYMEKISRINHCAIFVDLFRYIYIYTISLVYDHFVAI